MKIVEFDYAAALDTIPANVRLRIEMPADIRPQEVLHKLEEIINLVEGTVVLRPPHWPLGSVPTAEVPTVLGAPTPAAEVPMTPEAPATPRRRGRPPKTTQPEAPVAVQPEAAANPEASVSAAPVSRRRRAPAPAVETPAVPMAPAAPETRKLTISDVMKAASAAAEKIAPKGVGAVLARFNVSILNELPQAQWGTFIDALEAEVKKS